MKYTYPRDNPNVPRYTSRGIVIRGDLILLVERWRDGLHYFSIPGGGNDTGETLGQTAKREIFEETSLHVDVERKLYEMDDQNGNVHTVFLCIYKSGEPVLSDESEEAHKTIASNNTDRYDPKWMPVSDVKILPFLYWEPIGKQLANDLENGWPDKPITLHAD